MEADGRKATKKRGDLMEGFSPVSPPRIFWNSRKRSASGRSLQKAMQEENLKATDGDDDANNGGSSKPKESSIVTTDDDTPMRDRSTPHPLDDSKTALSGRRKALFEPLDPTTRSANRQRVPWEEDLLPPPDFESASYPRGWLVGKKRKLVNVDVVESMRRIAVQEMNRKDREIDGLNEQLEEDARCLDHLQLQLLEERRKRADTERENSMLHNQISMLMNMLHEEEEEDDDAPGDS